MERSSTTIQEMKEAFDSVIPGYAVAWNEAFNTHHGYEEDIWKNTSRKYLTDDERCLLIYGCRNWGNEGEVERIEIIFLNRGHVPLMNVKFPDNEKALNELRQFNSPKQNRDSPFFYRDGEPFDNRVRITFEVLEYIKNNAVHIEPMWNHETSHPLHRTS